MLSGGAIRVWNDDQKVPFVKDRDQLVAFEHEASLGLKVSTSKYASQITVILFFCYTGLVHILFVITIPCFGSLGYMP